MDIKKEKSTSHTLHKNSDREWQQQKYGTMLPEA